MGSPSPTNGIIPCSIPFQNGHMEPLQDLHSLQGPCWHRGLARSWLIPGSFPFQNGDMELPRDPCPLQRALLPSGSFPAHSYSGKGTQSCSGILIPYKRALLAMGPAHSQLIPIPERGHRATLGSPSPTRAPLPSGPAHSRPIPIPEQGHGTTPGSHPLQRALLPSGLDHSQPIPVPGHVSDPLGPGHHMSDIWSLAIT